MREPDETPDPPDLQKKNKQGEEKKQPVIQQLKTVPNMITIGRVCAIPVLFLFIFLNVPWWIFLPLYFLAGISDFFDGLAARLLDQKTEVGKLLDAWADFFFVLSTAAFLWLLFEDHIRPNLPLVIILFLLVGVSLLISLIRHKKAIFMHTWILKANLWAVIITFCLSFFINTTLLITLVIASYYVGFTEQTLIFLIADEVDPDTPSIVSILGGKKQA